MTKSHDRDRNWHARITVDHDRGRVAEPTRACAAPGIFPLHRGQAPQAWTPTRRYGPATALSLADRVEMARPEWLRLIQHIGLGPGPVLKANACMKRAPPGKSDCRPRWRRRSCRTRSRDAGSGSERETAGATGTSRSPGASGRLTWSSTRRYAGRSTPGWSATTSAGFRGASTRLTSSWWPMWRTSAAAPPGGSPGRASEPSGRARAATRTRRPTPTCSRARADGRVGRAPRSAREPPHRRCRQRQRAPAACT